MVEGKSRRDGGEDSEREEEGRSKDEEMRLDRRREET